MRAGKQDQANRKISAMGLTVTGNGANDRRVMHGLVVDDGAVKAGASFTPVGGQVVSRFAKLES